MSETIKINLTKVAVVLVIVMTLASVVGGGYIAYDNAKTAKADGIRYAKESSDRDDVQEARLNAVEQKQARFEGVMDERTKNTAKRVDDIYDIVKDWSPDHGKD